MTKILIAWLSGHLWLVIPALAFGGLWCLWRGLEEYRLRYDHSPENPDWHAGDSGLPVGSPLDEDLDDDAPDPAATPAP